MLEATKHKDPFVRTVEISSLAKLELDRVTAIEVFARHTLHDNDSQVRVAALEVLGGDGVPMLGYFFLR